MLRCCVVLFVLVVLCVGWICVVTFVLCAGDGVFCVLCLFCVI